MSRFLSFLKPYRVFSVLAPLFKLLEATLELFVPIVMAHIIDEGIAGEDEAYILKMGAVLIALALVGLFVSITAQYFAARAATGFARDASVGLFRHIMSLSQTEYDRLGASALITRVSSDMTQVQSGVNLTLRLLLRSPFIVFGAMIMAFTIDVRSALIFTVVIPVLAVIVSLCLYLSVPLYKNVQSSLEKILLKTRENLEGVRVLRAFVRQDAEKKAFTERGRRLKRAQMKNSRIQSLMNPLTFVVVNIGVMVLIYTGALRVDSGVLTQGEMVALINYMSQILVELVKLANLIISINKALACWSRIDDVFEVEGELDRENNSTDEVEKYSIFGSENKINSKKIYNKNKDNLSDIEKRSRTVSEGCFVRMNDVSFTYLGSSEPALNGVSFSLGKGETLGVIGGTGSGKSTLVNLLLRLYNVSSGEMDAPVNMDDVAVVPQRSVLFAGTVRENLLLGIDEKNLFDLDRYEREREKNQAEGENNILIEKNLNNKNEIYEENNNTSEIDSALWQALRAAQADEFVREKGGLDAAVDREGRNFSGGQRQRLCIARALARNPRLLILDDSFSALDTVTEKKIAEALSEKRDVTKIIISQRINSIKKADKILVLDDGEQAGLGTHDELMQNCEIYSDIARIGGAE